MRNVVILVCNEEGDLIADQAIVLDDDVTHIECTPQRSVEGTLSPCDECCVLKIETDAAALQTDL